MRQGEHTRDHELRQVQLKFFGQQSRARTKASLYFRPGQPTRRFQPAWHRYRPARPMHVLRAQEKPPRPEKSRDAVGRQDEDQTAYRENSAVVFFGEIGHDHRQG